MDPISNIASSLGDWLFASPKAADPALRGSATLTFADLLPQAQAALTVRAAEPGTESTGGRALSDADRTSDSRPFLPARSDDAGDPAADEADSTESDLEATDASDAEPAVAGRPGAHHDEDDLDEAEASIGTHVRLDSDAPALPDAFETNATIDVELAPSRSTPSNATPGTTPAAAAASAGPPETDREGPSAAERSTNASRPIERAARAYAASVPIRDFGAGPFPRFDGLASTPNLPASPSLSNVDTTAGATNDPRLSSSPDARPVDPRVVDTRGSTPEPRPNDLGAPSRDAREPRAVEPRTPESRTPEPRTPEPRTLHPRVADPRALASRVATPHVGAGEPVSSVPRDLTTSPSQSGSAHSARPTSSVTRPTPHDAPTQLTNVTQSTNGTTTPRSIEPALAASVATHDRTSTPESSPTRVLRTFASPGGSAPSGNASTPPVANDQATGSQRTTDPRYATTAPPEGPPPRPSGASVTAPAATAPAATGPAVTSPVITIPAVTRSGGATPTVSAPAATLQSAPEIGRLDGAAARAIAFTDAAPILASSTAAVSTARESATPDVTNRSLDSVDTRAPRSANERASGIVDSRAPAAATASTAGAEASSSGASTSATPSGTEGSNAERAAGTVPREAPNSTSGSPGSPPANPGLSAFESSTRAALDRPGASQPTDAGRAADPNLDASVLRQLQGRFDPSRSEIRLRLTPEHLGEVRMNVRLVDGRVQVLLDAEHASTRMLLDRNLPELRETLARAGVSIDDVRLTTNDDAPRSRAATPGAAMQPDTSDATPSRDDGASADDRRSRPGSHETIRTTSRFSLDAATGNDATHPDEPTTPDPSPPNGAGIGTRLNLVV